jgi:hypothetical protein
VRGDLVDGRADFVLERRDYELGSGRSETSVRQTGGEPRRGVTVIHLTLPGRGAIEIEGRGRRELEPG